MASLQPHRRHLPINAKKWQEPFDGSRPTIQDIKKEEVPVLTHPLFVVIVIGQSTFPLQAGKRPMAQRTFRDGASPWCRPETPRHSSWLPCC